ncbi:MAG: DUF5305 family protein [Bacillota bacterium]|jgi:hypothetical protein|nr:DUF5305 domain-containing protein [Clostridia bacterium]
MKKIRINKTIRNVIIVFLICALPVLSYGVYYFYNLPLLEQNTPVFNYQHKAAVNYRVFYKPNSLYAENSMEKDKVYITNYIDYINTFLEYNYSGDRTAEIRGDYSVIAVVEAQERSNNEENQEKTIWSKDFVLVPKTEFSARDKAFSLKKELPVNLNSFNEFAELISKESGVAGYQLATIKWDINIEAETDKGTVKENITPTMTIPLRNKYFEVGGEHSVEKPGTIEEAILVVDPQKQVKFITCSVLNGLCIIVLILLLACTKGIAPDKLERKIKHIFKKYGTRLVELNLPNGISLDSKNLWPVKSFEDLIRIADEISKPIMYQYNLADNKNLPVFYVFDDKKIYAYEVTIPESENRPLTRPVAQPKIQSQ